MANGGVEREEVKEILVSKIRTGMKREFEMMMKAQAHKEINFAKRRVTRSQNRVLSANNAARGFSSCGTFSVGTGLKNLSVKKRKNEFKNEVLHEGKDDGRCSFGGFGANGYGGSTGEKVGLVNEEEEPMSDVLDGVSDDDGTGKRIEEGKEGGNGKGVMGLEMVGSDVVKNVGETGVDAGRTLAAEEPVDGIVEKVNMYLERGRMNSSVEAKSTIETSDANFKSRDAIVRGKWDTVTPLKQYTRKSKAKAVDKTGIENLEDPVPLGRITRPTSNTWADAPGQLGVEDEKDEVLESDVRTPVSSSVKLQLKMSKKVELKKIPVRLKDLLQTGLLEGLHVCYLKGVKVRVPGDAGLRGEIRGSGIMCFCNKCKGTEVVSPNQFEVHAGSGNKRPPEYIYLENGKTLRDVLNLCKIVPSDFLEQAIQIAVGRATAEESTRCLNCKGSMPQPSTYGRMLCDSCMVPRESPAVSPVLSDTIPQHFQERVPGDSRRVASDTSLLSVPSAKTVKLSSSSQYRSKVQVRLTRKDLRLHKLVFESDLLPDGSELAYYANGKKMREGYKSGHSIHCHCCHQLVSPSVFEGHAGFASRRKPYLHIYTSNGVSLHELSIEIKKAMNISTDESDDVCSICEGIGELLCCDNCPRAFHKECINLPNIPQDKWYCSYCENMIQREKFAASNINAVAAGRVAGVDPFEEIKKRCIRIVEPLETSESECFLCRGHDFSDSGFGPHTVILCDQCEREYHIGCLKEHGMDDLKNLPDEWFCSQKCRAMYSALKQLVGVGEKTLPDSMLNIIQKKQERVSAQSGSDLSLTWRLLRGIMAAEEHRKWLSGAVSVFHERFDPIGYSKSSRNDLIPTMVYGRSKQDQDFRGMYCAVLIMNSKVVSAGIFRIFGQELAEIPLVATRAECQGKGYFQSLLGCIENLLASMDVKEVVLPSASEAESIWKNKFGFENLSDQQLSKYRKDYPVMLFQDTNMLRKAVPKPETSTEAKDG